jgi:hypothetical protein
VPKQDIPSVSSSGQNLQALFTCRTKFSATKILTITQSYLKQTSNVAEQHFLSIGMQGLLIKNNF